MALKVANLLCACITLPCSRGVNRFADRRIWLKKSKRITDFCDKLNGLADFENRADHGSARNFGLDSGLYLF